MEDNKWTLVPISKISPNTGQIDGLPKNPRFIRDIRFEKLKQSIQDAPEMLEMRPLIVIEHGKRFIAICGNMRLRAAMALGCKELPCFILPESTPVQKLREYTIKDNIGYGQNDWDILANEWDEIELDAWGLETDAWALDEKDEIVNSAKINTEKEPMVCPFCGKDISKALKR